MVELPDLTIGQYSLVYNVLSFTFASMAAAFLFFVMAQNRVAPKYRISLLVSALVVAIAAYHYFRIFGSWSDAFVLSDGMYKASGTPFNDAYRYVDWALTVPLLVAELVLVLALARNVQSSLITKLATAAFLMIILGYPGEVASDNGTRALWGTLSSIPFVYILYILWTEFGKVLDQQPPRVKLLISNARLLMLATWGFYPIVYMAPFIGISGAGASTIIQVGYSIADVLAKAGFGMLIYITARAKSEADGWYEAGIVKE